MGWNGDLLFDYLISTFVRITQGNTEIFFFPLLLKSHVLPKPVQAVKSWGSFLQSRTVVMLFLLLTDRLISCQVIHRQEMGSLPSPSPCAFPCLGWFTVGMAFSPDGYWSELFGGSIWHLPVLRSLCRASVPFPQYLGMGRALTLSGGGTESNHWFGWWVMGCPRHW